MGVESFWRNSIDPILIILSVFDGLPVLLGIRLVGFKFNCVVLVDFRVRHIKDDVLTISAIAKKIHRLHFSASVGQPEVLMEQVQQELLRQI